MRTLTFLSFATALAASGAHAGSGSPPQPPHTVPGWYLGMPVLLKATPPPTDVDRASLPSFPVFVHAPVSETAGTAPMKRVPRPDGSEVVLPPHQDTLSELGNAQAPKLAIGYFVEIGPEGDASNVRVQAQPPDSWPGRPLASHIRIGPEWVPVNNHAVIAYGLRTGQLALEFFDVGGMMWGEPFGGGAAGPLAGIDCRVEPAPALPPVDWAGDVDHLPGQKP